MCSITGRSSAQNSGVIGTVAAGPREPEVRYTIMSERFALSGTWDSAWDSRSWRVVGGISVSEGDGSWPRYRGTVLYTWEISAGSQFSGGVSRFWRYDLRLSLAFAVRRSPQAWLYFGADGCVRSFVSMASPAGV